MGVLEDLVRARTDYERGDWAAALDTWSGVVPDEMGADDLRAAAVAAYLLGRRDQAIDYYQRAFHLYESAGDRSTAARCGSSRGRRSITAAASCTSSRRSPPAPASSNTSAIASWASTKALEVSGTRRYAATAPSRSPSPARHLASPNVAVVNAGSVSDTVS